MTKRDLLADLHERAHRGLRLLMDHCESMNAADLAAEFDGFGYPTILRQLHHIIGAERYWISVLNLRTDASEDEADHADMQAIRRFHEQTLAGTREYLGAMADDSLDRAVECLDWRGQTCHLTPSRVLLRTQTHLYHHHGQVSAMCRLAGNPVPPGFDFALD